MNKNKFPTVTIAVSAYNEEQNITSFLKSVMSQKEEDFFIKKIILISDGSTDRTVKFAKKLKYRKLQIIDSKVRLGKSKRLNQTYKNIKTDYLVQTDCDVIFSHKYIVRDMISPLMKNKTVAMCGGNPMPFKAENFVEEAINSTVHAYLNFRKKVRNGNNVFSADGRLLAYKKELLKKITVPVDMIANDMFTYYCCVSAGYRYKFVKSAIVYFRSPQNLKDQLRQNTRFEAAPLRMKKYFTSDLVDKESSIPAKIYIVELLKQFARRPIHCSFIFLINLYIKYKAFRLENRLTALWDMAYTTKRVSGNI